MPEALATVAYGYDKLGDQATAQQYTDVLKLNYPNLVKSNGEVNLRAARKEGSWVNRATLGVFGSEEQNSSEEKSNSRNKQQSAALPTVLVSVYSIVLKHSKTSILKPNNSSEIFAIFKKGKLSVLALFVLCDFRLIKTPKRYTKQSRFDGSLHFKTSISASFHGFKTSATDDSTWLFLNTPLTKF